jgi:hypothetical protein
MDVRSFCRASDLFEVATGLLLPREAEYYLMCGILLQLRESEQGAVRHGATPLLLGIFDGERLIAAAVQLPPRHVVLTHMSEDAVAVLAEHLSRRPQSLPGVCAPLETAHRFAQAWSRHAGTEPILEATTRVYKASKVTTPPTPGCSEVAGPERLDLVLAWMSAMTGMSEAEAREHVALVQQQVDAGRIMLWNAPHPVSMATLTRATPNGIGIGGVYTPPEYRRHGYASAVVAAITQRQLDVGRSFCALCSDASEPGLDRLYRRVGYRAVCDYALYSLS